MSKERDIPINPEKGIDPRPTYCRRCKCDTNELIVGDNRLMRHKTLEQTAITPRGTTSQTAKKLGWLPGEYSVEPVPEGKLPATEYCDSCKDELVEWYKLAKAGGVLFTCTVCNRNGVILAGDYADTIREEIGATPGEPCGVEFVECFQHHTAKDQDDSDSEKG
jgi:hypothetical protein